MESFILNGQGHGDIANRLLMNDMNPMCLRPFIGDDGRHYANIVHNGKIQSIVTNAPSTLRKDEWKLLDEAVQKAALPRLRFVADVRGSGLQYVLTNGMGKTVLETEKQSDIEGAEISMDGLRQGLNDRPLYDITNLPLPIVHQDFQISTRQLAVSRNGSTPLDTTMGELAGRKVGEKIENLSLGAISSFAYGGGTIYGITNFPDRNTKTMTAPTGSNNATVVTEILQMKAQSQADNF